MEEFGGEMWGLSIKREGWLDDEKVIDHHDFGSGRSIRGWVMNDNVEWKNVVGNEIECLYCKGDSRVEDRFGFMKDELIREGKERVDCI